MNLAKRRFSATIIYEFINRLFGFARDGATSFGDGDGTTPTEVRFATNQLTYAAIRWHQLYENPNVDTKRLKMRPLGHSDLMLYLENATNLLKKPHMDGEKFREHVNDLLRAASYQALGVDPTQLNDPAVSDDYHQRLVMLLTMGACEFHGFNAYFADSIREHGLDPKVKLYDPDEIAQMDALLRKADARLGLATRDHNKIYTTTNPDVADSHAKCSPGGFTFSAGNLAVNLPYLNRDYAAARANVLKLPDADRLTPDDKQQILTFFDKYWQKFATDANPQMVMLPYFRDPELLNTQIDCNLQYLKMWGPEKTINDILHGDCYQCYEHVYDEKIDLRDAEMFALPTAQSISRQITRSLANAQAMESAR